MARAVLLDALGTLLRLHPPAPLLVEELARRGVSVSEEEAAAGMRAEMRYYRAHHDSARDGGSLQELRARCAAVLADALPPQARVANLQEALMASLRFEPFAEVPAALAELRTRGSRLVVVSNWDVSLHEALERTGLAALVDAAISSAEHGARKPDPSLFAAALALAGAQPREAMHVGDDLEADVAGARGAGIEAVYVARDGGPAPPGVRTIRALTELLEPGP